LLFNLQRFELGIDDDGEPVSSCIVEPTVDAFVESSPAGRKIATLSANYRIVYDQLGKAIEAEGIVPPSWIPPDLIGKWVGKGVNLRTFSDRSIAALRTETDTKRDSTRRTFERARAKLQALGLIGIYEDFAWLIS
jgi:hypothetical protein